MACTTALLLLSLLMMTRATPPTSGSGRAIMSLDGEWSFALLDDATAAATADSGDTPPPSFSLSQTITVPGTWGAQGFGSTWTCTSDGPSGMVKPYCDPGNSVKHHHLGTGLYRKNVSITDEIFSANNSRVFVVLAGVMRAARMWVDGAVVDGGAWRTGQNSAHEFEITEHVVGARVFELIVAVTNVANYNLGDCLDGKANNLEMGGLWGGVTLEARPTLWLDEVFVKPIFDSNLPIPTRYSIVQLNVSAAVRGSVMPTSSSPEFMVQIRRWQESSHREIYAADHRILATSSMSVQVPVGTAGDRFVWTLVTLQSPRLWCPDATALYTATTTLSVGSANADVVTTRFAIKDLQVEGGNFTLNGNALFLAGTQSNFIYPKHEYGFPDKASYLKRMRLMRAYGYNAIRLSIHFETPLYYEAADEAGLLVQSAKSISQSYAGCNLSKAFPHSQWRNAIVRIRNHPSAFSFSMGNEADIPHEPVEGYYSITKQVHPLALCIDTDGCCVKHTCDGECKINATTVDGSPCDRPTNDYMVAHFGYCDVMADPQKYVLPNNGKECCSKPIVGHEVECYGQFPALSREMAGESEWNEAASTLLLQSVASQLDQLGLRNEEELWASSSAALHVLTYKLENEAARNSRGMKGINHLIFQSEWLQKEGLVGVNYAEYDLLHPQATTFKQFNGDVVLIAPDLLSLYTISQSAEVKSIETEIKVSNFGTRGDLSGCALRWELRNASSPSSVAGISTTLVAGQLPIPTGIVPAGAPYSLGTMRADIPASVVASLNTPLRLNFSLVLTCHSGFPAWLDMSMLSVHNATWENSWTTWLFPVRGLNMNKPAAANRPLYVDQHLISSPAIRYIFPTAERLPVLHETQTSPMTNAIVVLSPPAAAIELDTALALAEGGATVVLLQPPNGTQPLPPLYASFSFHDTVGENTAVGGGGSHFVGHVAYEALRALAPDVPGFTDASWAGLLSGFRDGWCSGVRCQALALAKTYMLDGASYGSGQGFHRSKVWLRGIPLIGQPSGHLLWKNGHVHSRPVHDAALVFSMTHGRGHLVVSGLVLGFEVLPWFHCGGNNWADTCPIEGLWMLRTLVDAATELHEPNGTSSTIDAGVRCPQAGRNGSAAINATTKCLQGLLDAASPGDTIILPVMEQGNWVVSCPLFIHRDGITLQLLAGVVLEAQRGQFHGKHDSLLTVQPPPAVGRIDGMATAGLVQGFTLRGEPGSALRMHREDYQDLSQYEKAEWRHALLLYYVRDVLVEGLSMEFSGGDGIYVEGVVNATIRKVEVSHNYRNGMSVIKADGLLVEDCLMHNTNGTNPQAGVDVEPEDDLVSQLVNVTFRRCTALNNTGSGFDIFLTNLRPSQPTKSLHRIDSWPRAPHRLRSPMAPTHTQKSPDSVQAASLDQTPFDVTLEDCAASNGPADTGIQSGVCIQGLSSRGRIVLNRFHASYVGGAGITVGKAGGPGTASLLIQDSVLEFCNPAQRSLNGIQLAPIFITAGPSFVRPGISAFGSIMFNNLRIQMATNSSWLTTIGPGHVVDIMGNVTLESEQGCPLRPASFGSSPSAEISISLNCVPEKKPDHGPTIIETNITVANPKTLPASIVPLSRTTIGIRGDYKPWVTQLKTGELLMVHRCNLPEASCTPVIDRGIPVQHAVMWRAPANGSIWTRTEHVMESSPRAPDLPGAEWSVHTLSDGTVFMLNGGCDYFYSRDHGRSFVANLTFNCTLCKRDNPRDFAKCGGNSASYNVIEVTHSLSELNVAGGLPVGLYLFGGNEVWRSTNSGVSFDHFKTVQNQNWKDSTSDNFFEQSGTPFLNKDGILIHSPRVGLNPKWDETDGSQLFISTDAGSTFKCQTNAAGNFCKRNASFCAAHGFWGADNYACLASNISFGGPGDHYPHMLQLRDGRVLLTWTKRCNPSINGNIEPACRDDGHGTGLRAILSDDGIKWDFSQDYIILSEQNDAFPLVPASGCGCGYGNTIEQADGTLVSVYCFTNATEVNESIANKERYPFAPHLGVLRWKLPLAATSPLPFKAMAPRGPV